MAAARALVCRAGALLIGVAALGTAQTVDRDALSRDVAMLAVRAWPARLGVAVEDLGSGDH